MKLSLGALGVLGTFAFVAFACADSETEAGPTETPNDSGLPAIDGGVEAPVDAAAEADVVTPPKVCSDSQLCHLPLPVKEKLVAVWGDGTGVIWSVTTEGSVLKLEAGAWKVHATGLGALVAVWGSSPTDIWVAGDKGVHHSTGGAFTASTLPGAFPTKVSSIWGTAANDVWATGETTNASSATINRVLRFDGNTWATVTVPSGNAYYRVFGHVGSGVWIAGSRPLPPPNDYDIQTIVVRRAPGKTTFATVVLPLSTRFPDQPDLDLLREVRTASTPSGTDVWLHAISRAGYPGVIRGASADGGATFTWTYSEDGALTSNPEYNAVVAASATDGWAVGEWGQVRRWDGTVWRLQAVTLTKLPVINELNAVWATADRAVIVGDGIAMEWRKP